MCVIVNVAGSLQCAPAERNHRGDKFCSDVANARGRVELIAALSTRGVGTKDFQWVQSDVNADSWKWSRLYWSLQLCEAVIMG